MKSINGKFHKDYWGFLGKYTNHYRKLIKELKSQVSGDLGLGITDPAGFILSFLGPPEIILKIEHYRMFKKK